MASREPLPQFRLDTEHRVIFEELGIYLADLLDGTTDADRIPDTLEERVSLAENLDWPPPESDRDYNVAASVTALCERARALLAAPPTRPLPPLEPARLTEGFAGMLALEGRPRPRRPDALGLSDQLYRRLLGTFSIYNNRITSGGFDDFFCSTERLTPLLSSDNPAVRVWAFERMGDLAPEQVREQQAPERHRPPRR